MRPRSERHETAPLLRATEKQGDGLRPRGVYHGMATLSHKLPKEQPARRNRDLDMSKRPQPVRRDWTKPFRPRRQRMVAILKRPGGVREINPLATFVAPMTVYRQSYGIGRNRCADALAAGIAVVAQEMALITGGSQRAIVEALTDRFGAAMTVTNDDAYNGRMDNEEPICRACEDSGWVLTDEGMTWCRGLSQRKASA